MSSLGGEATPTSASIIPGVAAPPKTLTWKGSSSESGFEREAAEEVDLTQSDGQSSVSMGAEAATTTVGLRNRCEGVERREIAVTQWEERLRQREMALKERERKLENARKDWTCLMEAHERGVRNRREEEKRREERERRSGETSTPRARKEREESRNHVERSSSRRSPTRASGANHASHPSDRAITSETTTSERGRQVSRHYYWVDLKRQDSRWK